jgi:hypothetical protein
VFTHQATLSTVSAVSSYKRCTAVFTHQATMSTKISEWLLLDCKICPKRYKAVLQFFEWLQLVIFLTFFLFRFGGLIRHFLFYNNLFYFQNLLYHQMYIFFH